MQMTYSLEKVMAEYCRNKVLTCVNKGVRGHYGRWTTCGKHSMMVLCGVEHQNTVNDSGAAYVRVQM